MDWQLFWLATTAAATTATAISTSIALLVQRRHRPEPDWAVNPLGARAPNPDHSTDLRIELTGKLFNAGDGAAFRVHLTGTGCEATIRGDLEQRGPWMLRPRIPVVAVVHPGDESNLHVRVARADWDQAAVVVEWTRTPTRLGKRDRVTIPIREITEPPEREDREG